MSMYALKPQFLHVNRESWSGNQDG